MFAIGGEKTFRVWDVREVKDGKCMGRTDQVAQWISPVYSYLGIDAGLGPLHCKGDKKCSCSCVYA